MKNYMVKLTKAEDKAFSTVAVDTQEWIDNMAHDRASKAIDAICEQALNDESHTILTVEEKQLVLLELNHRGLWFKSPKQLPADLKEQIMEAARVKTAAELNAELEASMP